MKRLLLNTCLGGLLICTISACGPRTSEPYKDLNLSFEERTEDLVSRMTLDACTGWPAPKPPCSRKP